MTAATTGSAHTYSIDPAHSEVVFRVRHLLTKVRGRFSEIEGTIEYDDHLPPQSSVRVTLQAASIDTNQRDRDVHLRSADFFDVAKFPTVTFTSTRLMWSDGHNFEVTGDLTMHGVRRPVTLAAALLGKARDPLGKERLGFEGSVTINRKDFGLSWNAALETGGLLLGDEVEISLSVQAVRKSV